jgi:hypothetical protein
MNNRVDASRQAPHIKRFTQVKVDALDLRVLRQDFEAACRTKQQMVGHQPLDQ